jgi:hypothetical protein
VTAASLLRAYLESGALLALGWLALRWAQKLPGPRAAWLAAARVVFASALVLPIAAHFVPREALPRPAVQVWSGVSRKTREPYSYFVPSRAAAPDATGFVLPRSLLTQALVPLATLLALLVALQLARTAALARRLSRLPLLKRLGRVRLLVGDDLTGAYAA